MKLIYCAVTIRIPLKLFSLTPTPLLLHSQWFGREFPSCSRRWGW